MHRCPIGLVLLRLFPFHGKIKFFSFFFKSCRCDGECLCCPCEDDEKMLQDMKGGKFDFPVQGKPMRGANAGEGGKGEEGKNIMR